MSAVRLCKTSSNGGTGRARDVAEVPDGRDADEPEAVEPGRPCWGRPDGSRKSEGGAGGARRPAGWVDAGAASPQGRVVRLGLRRGGWARWRRNRIEALMSEGCTTSVY